MKIDGSYGEGGGQILRTSLALSCVTGKPFEIVDIRKTRKKPGLQPQHLTSVEAAVAISGAHVEGAALSSSSLAFIPGPVKGSEYLFDVSRIRGSAGSISLVLQTVLLPLCFAGRQSSLTVIGGTHVPWSPTFHYLKYVFLPVLAKIGALVELDIDRWGWYPAGGGRVKAKIDPVTELKARVLTDRGKLKALTGMSAVANLSLEIAVRQRNQAVSNLAKRGLHAEIEILSAPSQGKGTVLFVLAEFENAVAGFDSLGALGKRAETVADEAFDGFVEFLNAAGAVDPHLADQIVPYLALAEGTSEFTTTRITPHLLTNIWVVRHFLNAEIAVKGREGEAGTITINGCGSGKKRFSA